MGVEQKMQKSRTSACIGDLPEICWVFQEMSSGEYIRVINRLCKKPKANTTNTTIALQQLLQNSAHFW